MKRIYSLYSLYAAAFVLVLAGGVILLTPPTTVYACGGYATCPDGTPITIPPGATDCSCTDNIGCTWTAKDGKKYTQKCATRAEDGSLPEEGPDN
jgi:hypothetical protein